MQKDIILSILLSFASWMASANGHNENVFVDTDNKASDAIFMPSKDYSAISPH